MKKTGFKVIRMLDILAILTFVITFTPIVIPQNEIRPVLAGIPYTMWMGFLVSVVFVVLAYLVSILHQGHTNDR